MENKYDVLKMYFGRDYHVTNEIVIKQPSIGQIIDYGENKFWVLASTLCANPTSMRLQLWNNGIDWNEIDDFTLFAMLTSELKKEDTEILFGNLDFTKFRAIKNDEDKLILVYMPNPVIQIDEDVYSCLVGYLRNLFDIHPKVEKAKGKATKIAIIEEEERNLEFALRKQKKEKWNKSMLFPLISSALNHPGFKYKKDELENVDIFEFMDSAKRLQIYESVTSFMTGMYMGMIDTSKIDIQKELNWMRDLYDK